MNNYVVRFLANSILRVVGIKRLANYAALSIGPKLIDHVVNASTKGVIPVGAVRVLRTSLSYAPIAVIMGTGGTSLINAITYYVIVQISETICMLVVRKAVNTALGGAKYVLVSTYRAVAGSGGSTANNSKEEELLDWVVLEKQHIKEHTDLSEEQLQQVEQYVSNIDIENEIKQQEEEKKNISEEELNDYIKREIDDFVILYNYIFKHW
ncbi:hypothetical protein PPL_01152 [Heterostelium album PN500]|uniref:Uncharacterized protein n=1 Tax=Heterostelium pallidum (strain ATCC 26659 / Pp 5 / PN500) TaxID=670386 RepID=D3AY93_HETP5|nr:hypothetical protein PPL_01152 [Heterostelium album PN500]EFA85920.1 hypothetical protein PPL_01152 [Heterostelium album PN500]|eukprot:XP_020438026.1 hypothetical protein PPL_01152 [Heterostelium album PN500]